MLGAAHPKEFSFPVFIGVLEEGEDDPARDPGEAYPKAFPLFLHRLVHEEEGTPLSRSVIHTHRLPRSAGTNGDMRVMSAAESIKVIQVGIPMMIL